MHIKEIREDVTINISQALKNKTLPDAIQLVYGLEKAWWSKCRSCTRLTLVSLRNRTVGRRGRQIPCAWWTWQGYYLRVLSWFSRNINVFWSFTKRSLYRRVKFGENLFHTKLLSRLSHRFAVFFSLPSSCESSLLTASVLYTVGLSDVIINRRCAVLFVCFFFLQSFFILF